MSRFEMKLPDVGEGVAEAELVSWMVEVGDEVTPESSVAELLTDKSNVEISSPVAGTVVELHGEPGDVLAVGSNLIVIDTGGDSDPTPDESEASDAAGDADASDAAGDPTEA
ncbi:MAG: biotin/lipoyl-containing protein, partial [Ilumatobacter sp.]